MSKRKTWWSYSLDHDAIDFLRQPDPLQRSILCNLKSYSEHGALFAADPDLQDKINRIVHLKGVFDGIRRRGYILDPSDASTLSCDGPHGQCLRKIDETDISRIDQRRQTPDLDQLEWPRFEEFLTQFVKTNSKPNIQLLVVDRFALKGQPDQIERKLTVVARLVTMISRIHAADNQLVREVKLIHSRDRKNISSEECRDIVRTHSGNLPNAVRFHCLRCDHREIHARYVIWPWWYLILDKGLDTFWIDDHDRIRLDQPDAWLELRPWPTEPPNSFVLNQGSEREVLSITRRFASESDPDVISIP